MARIVVVDDDRDILSAVSEVLQDEGHTVASATGWKDLVKSLHLQETPDLILLDLMILDAKWSLRIARQYAGDDLQPA